VLHSVGMSRPPVSVVTGANSGIGRATAIHLAEHGHVVFGTVRSTARAGKLLATAEERGTGVELVELDIGDDASVHDGFAEVLERAGHIDHLVNNAGIGGNGVVEETTPERLAEVFDVDVIGAVRCAQAVLPHMRERGSGTIVNVTSVAGRIGAIAQAPYVAAKWALEGLSEQLALEVAPFGIRVAIIEPGITKSSIFGKNTDAPNDSGAYEEHYGRMLQMYAAGYIHASDAVEVGEVIREAIETQSPKLRWPVSWGGVGITAGRAAMTDEEWVAMGLIESRDDYMAEFERRFSIDIST
jgi:NAD(P)-dependent dehydrogenase (short-subunit alcohol dehydrogenase family)